MVVVGALSMLLVGRAAAGLIGHDDRRSDDDAEGDWAGRMVRTLDGSGGCAWWEGYSFLTWGPTGKTSTRRAEEPYSRH